MNTAQLSPSVVNQAVTLGHVNFKNKKEAGLNTQLLSQLG